MRSLPVSRRPGRPTARPTSWVLAGSAASGVGAYLFQVVGARALGDAGYAPIGVLWTLQYLALSVPLLSVEAYVARTVTLQRDHPAVLAHPLQVIWLWLVVTAVLVAGVSYRLRDALFNGIGELPLVAGAIVLSFGGFVVVRGRLAGAGRFRSYGAATGLESVLRVAVATPVLALAPSPAALAWTMPLGPLAVLAWWAVDRRRLKPVAGPEAHGATPQPSGAGRFLASTTAANACAQTLLAAGPLVLVPLGAGAAELSVFFITVTAARAPLAFAVGGLLSRLLPPLTRMAGSGAARPLRRVAHLMAAVTVAVAAAGGGLAWLVGPELVTTFFGASFRPGRLFTALTAFGVLLATGSLLLNQVLIARSADSRLVPPWVAALAAATAVILATPGSATMRVTAGFVVGEVVALAGLLLSIATAGPLPAAGPADRLAEHGDEQVRALRSA